MYVKIFPLANFPFEGIYFIIKDCCIVGLSAASFGFRAGSYFLGAFIYQTAESEIVENETEYILFLIPNFKMTAVRESD